MGARVFKRYRSDWFELVYLTDGEGRMGLCLLPAGLDAPFAGKGRFDSLAHVRLSGDAFDSGFSNGATLRAGETTQALRFAAQVENRRADGLEITSTLRGNGVEVEHHLTLFDRLRAVECFSVVRNLRDRAAVLELASSFSLGGLSPFSEGDGAGELVLHRMLSCWSSEGRPLSQTPEELNFEPSWSGHGVRALRFGQLGSHPVKTWFPFAAVEDRSAGVTWAAELCCASSWQMEFARRGCEICLGGGLADADFGHWRKNLAPGECFETPRALMTVARGGLDAVRRNLCAHLNETIPVRAEAERALPVMFNEFCTTWGNPSLANIKAVADRVAGHGCAYFVIDAGWYARPGGTWEADLGDWQVSRHMFPGGIREAADYIRQKGMIPGLWFELENVGATADAAAREDWLLRRDGQVLRVGGRRLLDFENPEVVRHLDERVIGLLQEAGFGYVKVDYNESIGAGCDGYESPGEGLRRKVLANQAYFRRLRERLPGLVIESCASGGHRLEPSMLMLSDLSSFSDAHECPEIPVIAANIGALVPARQNQIWAVLRADDGDERLYYSLSATMLGRMCLSGDVHNLSDAQWAIVDAAIAFYGRARPLIQSGELHVAREGVGAYRHLTGRQCALLMGGGAALAVAHNFTGSAPVRMEMPGGGDWVVEAAFGVDARSVSARGGALRVGDLAEGAGCALLMKRAEGGSEG